MIISATNRYQTAADVAQTAAAKAESAKADSTKADSAGAKEAGAAAGAKKPDVDTFVRSSAPAEAETKKLSADEIRKYQEQREQSFTKMLNDIVSQQANAGQKASQLSLNGLTKDFFTGLTVTPEQALAAQQSISEDGEWGVNAVATRIMDMVMALSGGDSSKAEEYRAAVDKGFKQAEKQWGGELPGITGQTHDELNKRFDYWKETGSIDGYQYQSAVMATQ